MSAAIESQYEDLKGVSSRISLGLQAYLGTGSFNDSNYPNVILKSGTSVGHKFTGFLTDSSAAISPVSYWLSTTVAVVIPSGKNFVCTSGGFDSDTFILDLSGTLS